MDAQNVASAANLIAHWCALRDVSSLAKPELEGRAGIVDGIADLFVLFGGGVVGSVDVLARAIRSGIAHRFAIVGGRGHATYWLDRAFANELGVPTGTPYSEAQMLDELLSHRHGLHADLLETRSTNCGNNISNLMDLLEGQGQVPQSIILCQDAVMQRRMDATWRRQAQDRTPFANTRVVNWASYDARLGVREEGLVWEFAPEGIWPKNAYIKLLVGEVSRLLDNEEGYGPRGRGFIAHVDVPPSVRTAARQLQVELGDVDRPPDERYA